MEALEDLAKLVDLQKISTKSVKPKCSYREGGVIFNAEDVWRVTKRGYKKPLCQAAAELVKLRREILAQGVVHVEAIAADGGQVQALVDEYSLRHRNILLDITLRLGGVIQSVLTKISL